MVQQNKWPMIVFIHVNNNKNKPNMWLKLDQQDIEKN